MLPQYRSLPRRPFIDRSAPEIWTCRPTWYYVDENLADTIAAGPATDAEPGDEAGVSDILDASETAPTHGGASSVTEGDDTSSADAGDLQSAAPADPDPTAADSEQAADSTLSPAGDSEPATDNGKTPAPGRDADEGGFRADSPATGQADANDDEANPAASSSAGGPEPGADGDEAIPASSDTMLDATRETEERTDTANAGGVGKMRSSEARDFASHTDSVDASDGDGQLSLGYFTTESTPGSDTKDTSLHAGF